MREQMAKAIKQASDAVKSATQALNKKTGKKPVPKLAKGGLVTPILEPGKGKVTRVQTAKKSNADVIADDVIRHMNVDYDRVDQSLIISAEFRKNLVATIEKHL